jgi:hypothetical protein
MTFLLAFIFWAAAVGAAWWFYGRKQFADRLPATFGPWQIVIAIFILSLVLSIVTVAIVG